MTPDSLKKQTSDIHYGRRAARVGNSGPNFVLRSADDLCMINAPLLFQKGERHD